MSKAIVIYTSKRGSTEQYAKWIAEELDCVAISYDSALKKGSGINLYDYDCIIYGGWIRGSGIVDFDSFRLLIDEELRPKLIVFGVGVAMESAENYKQVYEINYKKFAKDGAKNPTLYILSGAYDPKKVSGFDGALMKVMKTVLKSGKTIEGQADATKMLDRIENGVDLVDRSNITSLVKEAKKMLCSD